MNMKYNRIDWIDICKGLGIYCVVLAHVGTWGCMSKWIHAFHMPIFFLLSGYCYNEKKYHDFKTLLISRIKTLIFPYTIFGFALFAFWNAALYSLGRSDDMRTFSNLLYGMAYNTEARTFAVANWFMTAIFFTAIIFWVLLCLCRHNLKKVGCGLIVLSIIAYLYPLFIRYRLPLAIDSALSGVAFYGVGWILRSVNINAILEKVRDWQICVGGGILTMLALFVNPSVNMRNISYGNYFLFYIDALGLSFTIIAIAYKMRRKFKHGKLYQWTLEIGQNTLTILLLQSTAIRVWEVLFGGFMSKFSENVVYMINLFVALILVVLCTVCGFLINRYCPIILGKSKKQRMT